MSKVGSSDSENTLYCSFCGKRQHAVRKLIGGPTVFICEECIWLCMDIVREENKSSLVKSRDDKSQARSRQGVGEQTPPLSCSFCEKSQHDVRKLIAGPTVFICDECVDTYGASLRRDGIVPPPRFRLIDRMRAWIGWRTDGNNS